MKRLLEYYLIQKEDKKTVIKSNVKKILVFMLITSLSLLSCDKKESENITDINSVSKTENQEQNKNTDTTDETKESSNEEKEEMNYGEGIDEEFTTDGKLHEDKLLNKKIDYPDSPNSFKIEKDGNGYYLIRYTDISPEEGSKSKIKEEKSKLKLEKDIYLVDDNGLVYAYDTKLKKLVFLNKGNNYRIISVSDDE